MPKAAPQPESLAKLALPVTLARKAQSERQARKAAPWVSSPAQLALPAKQARKASSEQPAHKAPLVWWPAGPYIGTFGSITTARSFGLLR